MTGVLLAAGAGDDPISAAVREAPIELRREDSLKSLAAPIRNVPAVMVGILIGSFAAHAILLATAVIGARPPVTAPQQEIAVDIVQDVPKPAAPPKPVAKPVAHAAAKPPAPAKPPPPKVQEAKLEPASKPEAAKPMAAKPEAPKPGPAKPELAKPELAKPDPSKPVAAKSPLPQQSPPAAKPMAPQAAKEPADSNKIEALQKELAELRAQQTALKSELQDPPTTGGPLAGSLQAVAMSAIGVDGEAVGYQELVFSQLAKAKGDGEYHGQAGTTGVKFAVDANGQLLGAEVAASSGSPVLDKEALDIVHRAAPFPAPPKDANHTFFANVNFRPPKA